MSKPLYIPPAKKFVGLHVQCTTCDALIDTGICKQTGKSVLTDCPHADKHVFKAILHVPKTKNERRTKILESRTYEGAIKELLAFKESLKEIEITEETKTFKQVKEITQREVEKKDNRTYALAPLMARYIDFLHNDPKLVPEFRKKVRSKSHLADVERVFLRFATAAKNNNRKVNALGVDTIDDEIIGEFLQYLTDDLEIGNAGYNRTLTVMTSFYRFLIEKDGYQIKNPFVGIMRKPLKENVETIEDEQFSELIEAMGKPELGIHTFSNGKKKNYWKPFLQDGAKLLLYSGRRRTEAVLMRWNHIFYRNDIAEYISVPDYKYNNAKNLSEKDWKYNYVPVTEELSKLLNQMGAKTNHHSSKYILAPDEKMKRETMASFLSKAFAHYAEKIGLDLSLGSLRRTNFSSLSAAIGMENARTISGHASLKVMKQHYISKRVLAKTAQEFNVFGKGKEDSRQKDLDAIRNSDKDISLER